MRLARVFNDRQMILDGQLQNGIHIGRLAVKMYRNNCGNSPSRFAADRSATAVTDVALRLKILNKFLRVQVISALINVYKLREGACLRDGLRGCNKRVWDGDYGVALVDSGANESKSQGVGSAADSYAVFCTAKVGIIALKVLHHRPTHKRTVP